LLVSILGVMAVVAELRDGRRVAGPPKSAAGVRIVALPAMLVDAMKRHLPSVTSAAAWL
jgi:hypothetical protein